ncbi:MAG: SGNH/GDSL hydrolase family protein [Bacteriovorax sp.]|nr:SGNH/GDSL hydrolase family protein [Bacteriovorax sp.]
MKKTCRYKLLSILVSLVLFFFFLLFGEFVIRLFDLKPYQGHGLLNQQKINPSGNAELKKILTESSTFKMEHKYPQFQNEEVDYSKKFEPNILVQENQNELKPNVKSTSIARTKTSGAIIYKVNVTTDSFGRRYTPVSAASDSNILFFGDSFTFGEGVNDNETFPYHVSIRRPKSAVYNLGVPGLGLNDLLFDLEFGNAKKYADIPKRKSISVYTYMNDHLVRFFCSVECYRERGQWLLKKARFDRKLYYQGTFSEANSTEAYVYKLLAKSQLLAYLNINWPMIFTNEHFDTFARAVRKVKNLTREKFGSEKFYFVFYPRNTSLIYAKKLIPYLKKYNIDYLVYEDIDYDGIVNDVESIPLDRHPTPIAHYLTAYLLDRDLPK